MTLHIGKAAAKPYGIVAGLALALHANFFIPYSSALTVFPLALIGSVLPFLDRDRFDQRTMASRDKPSKPISIGSLIIYVLLPLFLVFSAVVPVPIGLFFSWCGVILVCFQSTSLKTHIEPNPAVVPVGIERHDAAHFCMLSVCFLYLSGLAIEGFVSRGLAAPDFLADAVAASSLHCFGQNTFATTTRGGMPALVASASGGQGKLFTLSSENLQLPLFILAFAGSVTATVLFAKRIAMNLLCDVVALIAALYVVVSLLWWEIMRGEMDATPWDYETWIAMAAIFCWLVIRIGLQSLLGEASLSRGARLPLGLPRFRSAAAVVCIVLILIGATSSLHDPGVQKAGRVLVDESHSNWEKSDLPMETGFYGVKTLYNYGFLREILAKHFSSVDVNYKPLTKEVLSACDVLILKTPTSAYLQEEVEAIHSWVRDGGGVWLIGDHTNIFGMNTYLNQVAGRWDIRFNADAIAPLPGFYQRRVSIPGVPPVHRCGRRTHENLCSRMYLNHPIIGGDLEYLTVLTSCSVSAPISAEVVNVSRGTFVDHARFGGNTFFGNLEHDSDERYGLILQNVASKYGYGRIATWSDSTLFSNFSMCMSGVPELAVQSVDWLNRKNSIAAWCCTWLRAAVCSVTIILVAFLLARGESVFGACVAASVIVACCVPVVDAINRAGYVSRDTTQGFSLVGFEEQYSDLELPNKDHVHDSDENVFETLYVTMQRLHLMPRSEDRLANLVDSDVLFLINPKDSLREEDLACVRSLLRRGKSVVAMIGRSDDPNTVSMAAQKLNEVLLKLGAEERIEAQETPVLTDAYGKLVEPYVLTDIEVMAWVASGTNTIPLLFDASGRVIISSTRCNGGQIVLCTIADVFSNARLGEPTAVPSSQQALLFKGVYQLMERVASIDLDRSKTESWRAHIAEKANDSMLHSVVE